MKCFILVASTVIIGVSTQAQYKIREYKNPNLNVKGLTIDAGQGSSAWRLARDFSLSGNLAPKLFINTSSDQFITENLVSFIGEYSGQKNMVPVTGFNLTAEFRENMRSNNRMYSQHTFTHYVFKNIFYRLGGTSSIDYNMDQSSITSPNAVPLPFEMSSKDRHLSYQIGVPISIGAGRVYESGDAQIINYIISDLKRNNSLDNVPTDAQMLELSKLATKIRNKRVFDGRNKRIYEITQLDSALKAMRLIQTTDINSATILYDNWLYAYRQNRLNGWIVGVTYSPSVYWSDNYENRTLTENFGGVSTTRVSEWEERVFDFRQTNRLFCGYYLPINNLFQVNATASVSTNNLSEFPEYKQIGSISMNWWFLTAFSYYPNSRTEMTLQTTGYVSDYTINSQDENPLVYNLSLDVNYFISPNLRLRASYDHGLRNGHRILAGFRYTVF